MLTEGKTKGGMTTKKHIGNRRPIFPPPSITRKRKDKIISNDNNIIINVIEDIKPNSIIFLSIDTTNMKPETIDDCIKKIKKSLIPIEEKYDINFIVSTRPIIIENRK